MGQTLDLNPFTERARVASIVFDFLSIQDGYEAPAATEDIDEEQTF
jgi:hypothetical protein